MNHDFEILFNVTSLFFNKMQSALYIVLFNRTSYHEVAV